MQLLLSIFADSFIIWARNFSLVYIILLALLLIGFLTPRELASGTEVQLLLMMGTLLLLMSAFISGWLNMISTACHRYFNRPTPIKGSPKNDIMENVSLFKYFLSGVSLNFGWVTLHLLLNVAALFAFSLSLYPLFLKVLPIFRELLASGQPQAEQLLSLPAPQRALMEQFSVEVFKLFLLFAIFNLLTALWPAYVAQYGDNILKAYWHSIQRFFRDPFRFLLIAGLFLLSQILFSFLSATFAGNILLGAFAQLGGLLFNIYMMIVLFVYVFRTSNRPLCVREAEGEPPATRLNDNEESDEPPPLP